MNTERLHAIAIAIKRELKATDQVSIVNLLAQELRQSVNEPTQPNHQAQVSSFRQQLNQVLTTAPSNDFSPARRQALEELGVATLIGVSLRDRIEEIFLGNEMTLLTAADQLDVIAEELRGLDGGLDNLLAGLGFFDIGASSHSASSRSVS